MDPIALPSPAPGVYSDPELMLVRQELLRIDPAGSAFGEVLRETIDQLLDGSRTMRYNWEQLFKTEKTHAGTLVEINLQRRFRSTFKDGVRLDYQVCGIEVDCKFSQTLGGWMLPPEVIGHLCLVVWASDCESSWSAGLLRADPTLLNQGINRDRKLTLSRKNLHKVSWLWERAPLRENVLLHLDEGTRSAVLAPNNGQQRINELFRKVLRRRITSNVVATLGMQDDPLARVREGKGRARTVLREEGIIIPGDYGSHRDVARALGGPVPEEGEFVSFKVTKAQPYHGSRPSVELDGCRWVAVHDGEEVLLHPAPMLPPR